MKHLYLIRHAKSSWADDSLRDHERPLNDRGRRQLAPMSRVVLAQGALEGPVFCSTANRARQTLEGLVADNLCRDIRVEQWLYTFNYRMVRDWLRGQEDDRITLIGHNPALEDLAAYLLKDPPASFPTCSFMHIALPLKHWQRLGRNKGRLELFLRPKDVGCD